MFSEESRPVFEAHSASYSVGSGDKVADHSHLSAAEVKNEWN